MTLLLDTHVFLWCLRDDRRLGRRAREAIGSADRVLVSAASVWELAIKIDLGKLEWAKRGPALSDVVGAAGFAELPILASHAARVRGLPRHHADPFDRLLIAQALSEGATIVTSDDTFERYAAPVVAADR